jgi:hypothetical protein
LNPSAVVIYKTLKNINMKIFPPLFFSIFLFAYCKPKTVVQTEAKAAKQIFYPQIDSAQLIQDLYVLSADSLEGRETGTIGAQKAALYLQKRMRNLGLLPLKGNFEQSFVFSSKNGTNLHSYIKGKQNPEKYIVVSAHYDHLGIRNGKIYNGADDNASGVAVLLSLAEYLQKNPPKYSVIFCFFDAEEKGLNGSKAWVKNPPVPLKDIVFNLNLDMVSRSVKQELFFSGTHHTPNLKGILTSLQSKTPVKMMFGHDRPEDGTDDWTNQSDHYSFHQAKIPYLYIGVEDHADYHHDTDEADKIDKTFFSAVNVLIKNTFLLLEEQMEKLQK